MRPGTSLTDSAPLFLPSTGLSFVNPGDPTKHSGPWTTDSGLYRLNYMAIGALGGIQDKKVLETQRMVLVGLGGMAGKIREGKGEP